MSLKLLGDGFDIHGGGSDLVFPHHENEIAQAVGAGHEFARYWLHNGMLNVDGEKMSKSLGNFITLVDVLDQYDPRAFRLLVLQTHYRRQMEIGEKELVRRGEGGRAARRAGAPGARAEGLPMPRRSATSRRSATRWTTTSTRRPRSRTCSSSCATRTSRSTRSCARPRRRASRRCSELAGVARDRAARRRAGGRRRDRRAGRGARGGRAGPRTGPRPIGSAASSRGAASSSRTRRGGPSGAASEQGRVPSSAASRSKAGARCSSCCAPGRAQAARGVPVERGRRATTSCKEIVERAGGALQRRSRRSGSSRWRAPTCTRVWSRWRPPLRAADLDELLAVDGRVPRRGRRCDRSPQPRRHHALGRDRGRDRHRACRGTARRASRPVVAKAAAGAIEYLPIALVGGIPAAIERAARAGLLVGRSRRTRRSQPVRPRPRRPADRARARLRRPGPRASHARSLRRARAHPDAGPPRVAERLRGRDARVSRGRPPTPPVTFGVTPG